MYFMISSPKIVTAGLERKITAACLRRKQRIALFNEMGKKTLILGASANPERYSHLALHDLLAHGHPVTAVGKGGGIQEGITIHKEPVSDENIDTVTLYLSPAHQTQYYDYILRLRPKRIIFNPGTENRELAKLAESIGIQSVTGCTLVMLRSGSY
jgi:predicted CoA-binding protein